jgi:hypothetical protein
MTHSRFRHIPVGSAAQDRHQRGQPGTDLRLLAGRQGQLPADQEAAEQVLAVFPGNIRGMSEARSEHLSLTVLYHPR